jgi:hypothetical protein
MFSEVCSVSALGFIDGIAMHLGVDALSKQFAGLDGLFSSVCQ